MWALTDPVHCVHSGSLTSAKIPLKSMVSQQARGTCKKTVSELLDASGVRMDGGSDGKAEELELSFQ